MWVTTSLIKEKRLPNTLPRIKLTTWKIIQKAFKLAVPRLYFTLALIITIGLSYAMVYKAYEDGVNRNLLITIAILGLVVSSHFAFALVNWWATLWVTPKVLPKLDFSKSIPSQCRTLVAVPSLIVDHKQAEKLLEDLEVRFLANRIQSAVCIANRFY